MRERAISPSELCGSRSHASQPSQVHLEEMDIGLGKFLLDVLDRRLRLGLGPGAHVDLGAVACQPSYRRFAAVNRLR